MSSTDFLVDIDALQRKKQTTELLQIKWVSTGFGDVFGAKARSTLPGCAARRWTVCELLALNLHLFHKRVLQHER